MDFTRTQTYQNLARGFAGECQAGMRYQLTVKAAMKQGYEALADVVRTIAKNETNHARVFFEQMIEHGGSRDDVHIDAHYPFHAGTLEENLRFARDDEQSEAENIYPAFAKIAREEGFGQIALKFEQIAKVESHHRILFNYLFEAFKDGSLYAAALSPPPPAPSPPANGVPPLFAPSGVFSPPPPKPSPPPPPASEGFFFALFPRPNG